MESGGTDELVRPEVREELCTQARIGRERPGAHAETEALLNIRGNSLASIAPVVAHEGLEDNGKREGFALGDLRGEDAVAGMAVPELHGLELFVALPFPGDAGAPAVDAALGIRADEGPARMG